MRVIAYIDGFNLYHGLRSKVHPDDRYVKPWRNYYWLDLHKLLSFYLQDEQELVAIKYFTARVTGDAEKMERQSTYLDALTTLPNLKIIEGRYEPRMSTCPKCYWVAEHPKEKMTDVNIAVELIRDSYCDAFDVAFLISGDSDLVPPIVAVRELFPHKKVLAIFPPNRFSNHLAHPDVASGHLRIHERELKKSQFPPTIVMPNGFELNNPWAIR